MGGEKKEREKEEKRKPGKGRGDIPIIQPYYDLTESHYTI